MQHKGFISLFFGCIIFTPAFFGDKYPPFLKRRFSRNLSYLLVNLQNSSVSPSQLVTLYPVFDVVIFNFSNNLSYFVVDDKQSCNPLLVQFGP